MNFIEELNWRGMIHDKMPGIEEQLQKEKTTAYVGIDPTADSLHIGHLVSIMMLKHFQLAGHNPIVLLGGATGMIGDPSGKSEERNLLTEREIRHNELCVKTQLLKFLDFDKKENPAEILNNYDWTKKYKILDFLREIGKHITINYMLAKDSVKSRLETGISFTEFTYQLIQAYDFFWLYENKNCTLQMGGSDQWGNITTGMELIRRKSQGETFGLTCPLITKSDGGKFGKTEDGNIWLDPKKTSPYKFYQFWLNCSDEDSEKYIKIFTTLNKTEIEKIISEHKESPHSRLLQKTLAKFLTVTVHSIDDYNAAINASEILFGKGTLESLKNLPEELFLSIFEGVPKFEISKNELEKKTEIFTFLTETASIFGSKGEIRRLIKDNGISINKEKINENFVFSEKELLNDKYILVQKGKKNYFLIIVK